MGVSVEDSGEPEAGSPVLGEANHELVLVVAITEEQSGITGGLVNDPLVNGGL